MSSSSSKYDDLASVGPADSVSQVSTSRRSSVSRAPSGMDGQYSTTGRSRAPSASQSSASRGRAPSVACSSSSRSRVPSVSRSSSYYGDANDHALVPRPPPSAYAISEAPSSYTASVAGSGASRISRTTSYAGSSASTVRPSGGSGVQSSYASGGLANLMRPPKNGTQIVVLAAPGSTTTVNVNR
ncbi:MAG: hypothetical protein LQ340_005592, partial [Diploschistes diacapsis]